MNNGEMVILFLVVIIVGIALIVLLPGGRWNLLPQLAFWPFSRRREEALRMRLLRDKIASRRTWRGDLERRVTALEKKVAEETSVASRLSVGERRALHSLGPSPAGLLTTASPTTANPSVAEPGTTAVKTKPLLPSVLPGTTSGPAAPI